MILQVSICLQFILPLFIIVRIESLITAPTLKITDITNTSAEVHWGVTGCPPNYLEFEVLDQSSIVQSNKIPGMLRTSKQS